MPESRQPFHAGFGSAQTDPAKIARLIRVVERYTRRSLVVVIGRYRSAGHNVRRAAIIVGSDIRPERIMNPHIRAHAEEGQLFRRVVQDELRRLGLACSLILERSLYATAVHFLGRSEGELRRAAAALGRESGGRWRAEEKAASLGAWVILAKRRRNTIKERPRADRVRLPGKADAFAEERHKR